MRAMSAMHMALSRLVAPSSDPQVALRSIGMEV
jgi:hypothetical protein